MFKLVFYINSGVIALFDRLHFSVNNCLSTNITNLSQDYNPHKLSLRGEKKKTSQTFFCNLMTEVHFFSKRPAYFLSSSSFWGEKCEGGIRKTGKESQNRGLSIIGEEHVVCVRVSRVGRGIVRSGYS